MVKIIVPAVEDIAKKYVDVTPARAAYYEKEAPKAADRWFEHAVAAAAQYKAAVTAPNIEKMFAGGIKRVGAAKFKRKVEAVGIARYGPGVSAAEADFREGIAPYIEELARIDLPARKPRGDPGNLERVRVIFDALHKKRLEVLAATVARS